MKGKISKRLTAFLTAVMLIFNALPLSVLALSGDNGGTGSDWGETQSNSTWDIDHQGYRMCIVNSSGTAVSNAVDVLYRTAPNDSETVFCKSTRTGESTNGNYYYWTDLGITPPMAILWSDGPVGNGENVKTWFNANGTDVLNAKSNGSYIFTFNKNDDKNSVSGGKTVADVTADKGYYLTVEPITWFKPARYNNGTVETVYPYYIYGTIYNICAWWYSNSSKVNEYGIADGGNYSNVLHVLWQSMYIRSNIIGLTGSSSDSTFTAYSSSDIATLYSVMQTLGAGIHVYSLSSDETDSATCFTWYGTYDLDGNISWSCTSTVSNSTAIYNMMNTSSVSKDGNTYQQYKLTKNASDQWVLGSVGTASAIHYCTKNGTASTPAATLNSSSYSGTHYYFTTTSAEMTEQKISEYDIRAVHFVFVYSPAEAEITLTYPKGAKVITSVTAYNNTDEGMLSYSYTSPTVKVDGTVTQGGSTITHDTRASVTFSCSDWSADKKVTNITMAKDTTQLAWIEWTTPTNKDKMTVVVTPSSGAKLLNKNTGEYVDRLTIIIYLTDGLTENTPPDPTALDTSDGYDQKYVDSYLKTLSASSTGTGSWTVQKAAIKVTYTTTTVVDNEYVTVTVTQPVFHTYYYTDTYTASVTNVSAAITPSPYCFTSYTKNGTTYMKSGYGIYTEVTANVKVTKTTRTATYNTSSGTWSTSESNTTATVKPGNYNSAYSAVGFQQAESKFPEFYYGQTLNGKSRGSYNRVLVLSDNVFSFANNVYSTLNDTVHYTPLWYPDESDYATVSNIYYAYTPLGSVSVRNIESNVIVIDGNVYDDWHVAVVG